jgi:PAS domain S-box-containing protein
MKQKTKADLLQEIELLQRRIVEGEAKGGGPEITARKRAEAELAAMQVNYRALFDNVVVGLCRTTPGPKGTFIDVNPAMVEMFEADTREQLLALHPSQVYLDESQRQIVSDAIMSKGIVKGEEVRFKTLKGRPIWCRITAVKNTDSNGQAYFNNTLEDITERKRAEEKLRESNNYLENLINHANAPIIVWDPQFQIIRFNRAFESLTGRKAGDVVGGPLDVLFPPNLVESSMELIRKTQSGERWETVEINVLHRDGAVRTVLWNSATLFSADGKTPVATIAQGSDITDRKRAEETLRKSEAKYRTLVENIPQKIFVKDRDSRYVSINENFARDLGMRPDDLVGKVDSDFFSKELADKYRADDVRIMNTGQTETIEERYVQEGRETWVHTVKAPLRDSNGEIAGVFGVFSDITDRKRAERELQAANQQLRAGNQQLRATEQQLRASNQQLEVGMERLRESESKFKRLYDSNIIGVIFWDTAGNIIQANSEFFRIVGYTEEDILSGKARWKDMTPPEYAHLDEKAIKEMTETGISAPFEKEYIRKDGSRVSIRLNAAFLKGKENVGICFIQDITDRKRAERELQAANQQLRAGNQQLRATEQQLRASNLQLEAGLNRLAEAQAIGRIGSWEWDAVKDVISGSDEFCRLFGVGHDQLRTYQAFVDLLHPDDREHVGRDVQESLTKKALYDTQYRVRMPNGDCRHIHARGQVFTDDAGKPVRMVGTCLDITERRRAEQELDRLFSVSVDMIGIAGFDGYFKRLNPAWERVLGHSPDHILSNPFVEFVHPEDREATIAETRKIAQGVETLHFENRYRCKDGSYRWLSWTAIPVVNEGLMYCVARDITEHKRNVEALRIGKDRLLFATEGAKLGVWNWDIVTGELIWSDRCKALFCIRPDETMSYPRFSEALHPDDRERTDKAVKEALDNHTDYDIEYRSVWPDGSVHWLAARGRGYYDATGKAVRLEGVVLDIDERKRMEDELIKYRDELEQRVRDRTVQLEESNKELEAFSYSVSHDLRAPLRAIDGFTGILVDDYGSHLDTEGRRLCSVIHDNTIRMGRLIDNLLAFSRLGRVEMQSSRIDMGAMASSMFYELTTPESRGRIDFQIGSLPAAVGDPSLMRQVWSNLLGNAVKFSAKRERAVITVSGELKEGESVYAVRDNGAGFDMRYADKLFGVFQRLHSSMEFEGTGVGLALVQRVVRRHGGRVWAEGETGRGATFYFTLPGSK